MDNCPICKAKSAATSAHVRFHEWIIADWPRWKCVIDRSLRKIVGYRLWAEIHRRSHVRIPLPPGRLYPLDLRTKNKEWISVKR